MRDRAVPSRTVPAASSVAALSIGGRGLDIMTRGPLPNAALRLASATAILALLAGCGQDNTYVAPPPPKVTVATPVQQKITRYLEANGNTTAVNTANLVARVSGFLESIGYRDGDEVKKGQLLFTIEPEPYELKLKQSQAAEAGSEASLTQAEAEYSRQTELASRQVASKVAVDNATAGRETARANLKQAQVNTRLAALNVEYSRVTAPFDGIATARQVSVGEYVGGGGSATVLATIVQLDPIYANFNISERDLQLIQVMMERLGIKPDDLKKVPVEVGLQTETGYPHQGTLDYAAPSVTASTGTLAVRAILKNPKQILLPGYFVRVRVPMPQRTDALLVPDVALGSDQSGRYVLTVNKDNVVEQRKVQIGPLVGELRVIEDGLKPDDRVIVAGVLYAVPGQKIDPQTQPAATRTSAK
jgi:RND family efflux transporter MFP subunit